MKAVYACLVAVALAPFSPAFSAPQKTETKPSATPLSVRYRILQKKRAGRYDIVVTYPVFAGMSPLIPLANRSIREYAVQTVATFVREADAEYHEFGAAAPGNGWFLELHPHVSLARPDLISVYFDRDTYMGGPHPNSEYLSQSFGIVHGKAKQLALADLMRPGQNAYDVLSPVTLPRLKARGASSVVDEDGIKKLNGETLHSWCLTPNGLTLLFAPYEVASYAEGSYIVKLPFAELKSNLDPQGPLRNLVP